MDVRFIRKIGYVVRNYHDADTCKRWLVLMCFIGSDTSPNMELPIVCTFDEQKVDTVYNDS